MSESSQVHGLLAEFTGHDELLSAARRAHDAGYRQMDAYTPFPVEGLYEALGMKSSRIPLIVLIGGIVGAIGGYFMEWYAMAVYYPINVGGRPFNSWPAYIPITFELLVLCGALSAIVGMFILNRLPHPYHPVFNAPNFARATTDRFFLCIESADPKFELNATRRFLEGLEPASVTEVAT